MSDQTGLADDLLRGAEAIAKELFGARKYKRKVYHLQDQLPVFQLDKAGVGVLYAFRSRLRAYLEAQSAVKEQHIAAAAAVKPVVATSSPFKPKPRRGRRAGEKLVKDGTGEKSSAA
jgi:hypothetical protein